MIQRLETSTGTVYDMSKPWPGVEPTPEGVKDPNALKVGPIFFLPGEEEVVLDEDDEPTSTEVTPPRYEIWCVTDRNLTAFMASVKGEAIPPEEAENIIQSTMTRRTIHLDKVGAVDEDWGAYPAFKQLIKRFADMSNAEKAEEEGEEEPAEGEAPPQPGATAPGAAVAPGGNGATTPQAG